MSKTKISISLIKEGKLENEVLQPDVPSMELADGHKLYYKIMPAKTPKWISTFLDGGITEDDERFKTKNVSAVIIYKVQVVPNVERLFAVCFGSGRYLLRADITERRFGLFIVLNSVDPEKLRSIDTNSLMGVPRNNRIQSSILSNINGFNIDVDSDMLKSVVGKACIGGIQVTLSGTDALSVSVEQNYNEIEPFLVSCYQLFTDSHYLQNFDWIDQMQVIKDKTLVQSLDEQMLEKLNERNFDSLWVSIPDIIDYNIPSYFRLKSENSYDDVTISDIMNEYEEGLDTHSIKTKRLFCYSDENKILYSWTLYRCIYAEINIANYRYILNDGKWYKVNDNYVSRVEEYYRVAPVSDIRLPEYDKDKESLYNESVCNSNPEEFYLMDMKFIYIGGSKIEFCDIFTKNNQMIHVKVGKSSAMLSHLFAQGFVSANSFFDEKFRRKVNEKLAGWSSVPEDEELPRGSYEVVYAIAKQNINNGDKPPIPFFSKVNFMNYSRQLKRLGYKVTILGIKIP